MPAEEKSPYSRVATITCKTTLHADSEVFAAGYTERTLYLPTTASLTTLTIYCSDDGTTWYRAHTSAATAAADQRALGSAAAGLGGGFAIPLPDACRAARYLRFVTNVEVANAKVVLGR